MIVNLLSTLIKFATSHEQPTIKQAHSQNITKIEIINNRQFATTCKDLHPVTPNVVTSSDNNDVAR